MVNKYCLIKRCVPCHYFSPIFSELSTFYENAVFIKVDVDQFPKIAQRFNIQSMPTFHYVKNYKSLDEFSGADKDTFIFYLEKYY